MEIANGIVQTRHDDGAKPVQPFDLSVTGAFIRASPTHAHGVFVMKFEIIFTSETEPDLDVLISFAKQHDLKFIGVIEEEQEEDDRA